VCGRLYLVSFTDEESGARAEQFGAQLIDAREMPFMNCECGVFLDFTTEETARVM